MLFVFVLGVGNFIGVEGYPGSLTKFLLSFLGLISEYNGAWWYFLIYVVLVFTSSFWFGLLNRMNPYFYFALLLVIYIVAFYFRVYKKDIFTHEILIWFHEKSALYFCTLIQFMLGAFAIQYNWNEKIQNQVAKLPFRTLSLFLLLIGAIVFRGFMPNSVFAPISAITFIYIFTSFNLFSLTTKVLGFLAPHSTNLWLSHMFFTAYFFSEFTYSFQYPVLILSVLILVLIPISMLFNQIIVVLDRFVPGK